MLVLVCALTNSSQKNYKKYIRAKRLTNPSMDLCSPSKGTLAWAVQMWNVGQK